MSKHDKESVILLHGLFRSYRCMRQLAKSLQKLGYHTVNYDYPSTRFPIETLADSVIPRALAQCHSSESIHFVTHSMGGIILRYYLQKNTIPQLGRVVMLAPPNKGSELADRFIPYRWYRWLFGPAGLQLGTTADSFVNQLVPVQYEVGIIAGDKAFNWIGSQLLPRPNDGTVSVGSTHLTGMKDHLVLQVSHPFMMYNKQVIEQTLQFIQSGHFQHD